LLFNLCCSGPEGSSKTKTTLNKRAPLDVIEGSGKVYGIAVLGNNLFIVRGGSKINIYSTDNLNLKGSINIGPGPRSLRAIVACPINNCLFISDNSLNVVHRRDLSNNKITSWPIGGTCYGLSLTNADNGCIFATMHYANSVRKYTSDGTLVSEIRFDPGMDTPYHSIPLSSDQIVVSFKGATHQVRIVDNVGHILKSCGGSLGSGIGDLHEPGQLAFDTHGNILVADCYNNRIVRMTKELKHIGYVLIPKEAQQLFCPWSLHFDKQNNRLYIGEWHITGRVFVLNNI